MNPTINADALAHFMRGLFRDEITEEHALVASMKAVDVAPFQSELDAATHQHTVTFARASLGQPHHLALAAAVGLDPPCRRTSSCWRIRAARPLHRRHAGGAGGRRRSLACCWRGRAPDVVAAAVVPVPTRRRRRRRRRCSRW